MQGHVEKILQSLCATLETLERYLADPPLHWTDTVAKELGNPGPLPEAERLVAQLRDTIEEITVAFKPYLEEVVSGEVRSKLPVVE